MTNCSKSSTSNTVLAVSNLLPSRISFLMAMRYYAGNWPFSIWQFKGESHRKLDNVKKAATWVPDQLTRFYDRPTAVAVAVASRAVGWRLLHLQGRALADLIPQAVDRFEDYTWVDGELVCGMVLGYNFGDGHLHDEELLGAIQEQCGFEDSELRVIMIEAQPVGRSTCHYRIHDASSGQLADGLLDVHKLRRRQAWQRSQRPE